MSAVAFDAASSSYAQARPGRRVLLGEDDATLRDLLAWRFEQAGFAVLAAPDGRAVLAILSAIARGILPTPDVIVMDIQMPAHSGLELLEAVRAAEWSTPVILVTGFGSEATLEAAQRLQAAVLAKPVAMSTLLEKVFVATHRV